MSLMFVPIFVATGLAVAISIIGYWLVPGPDKPLHRTMLWTAVVMCWLMWLITYMSQMYYLAVPERANSTSH